MQSRPVSFKQAFFASPGPKNLKESGILYLKGLAMGAADIIPGVSGGTIALISGIYTSLLDALKSLGTQTFKDLAAFRWKEALAGVHLRFLLVLLLGIGTALVSLARLMHWLLQTHPVPTWAAFFGLILASSLILGQHIKSWIGPEGAMFGLGLVFGFVMVGLIPIRTPEDPWFIFLCGMIAICAMILPGISGSFLLLILGKYQYITAALRDPLNPESLMIIGLFLAGAVVGITGFSRFLSWLLRHYHGLTLAFLTGLITGSLRKIWPWKETLESTVIRGKTHILREASIFPPLDSSLAWALLVMLLAFVFTLSLEKKVNPA